MTEWPENTLTVCATVENDPYAHRTIKCTDCNEWARVRYTTTQRARNEGKLPCRCFAEKWTGVSEDMDRK